MSHLERVLSLIARVFNWVACSVAAMMVLLTVANVVGRLFRHPVFGSEEMSSFFFAILCSFPMAFVQILRGHIRVDFLASWLPKRPQAVIAIISNLACVAVLILLGWRLIVHGNNLRLVGLQSLTLHIPLFGIMWAIGAACILTALVFLPDLVKSLAEARKK